MSNISLEENLNVYNKLGTLTLLSENIAMSTEGFGSFLGKVGSMFLNKLNMVKEALGLSTKQANVVSADFNSYITDLTKNRADLLWVVNNVSYIAIKDARVMAPVGLKVDLIKAVDELEDGIKLINDKMVDALDELDTVVSSVLNDVNYRTQSKPLKVNDDVIKITDRLYGVLNKITDTKKIEDTQLVKDLIPNISCLTKLYDEVLKYSEYTSVKVLQNINEMIDNIYIKTQALESEMSKDEYVISKTVLKKLAIDLESAAKMVTVVMSVFYIYNQIILCINNMVRKFKNMR